MKLEKERERESSSLGDTALGFVVLGLLLGGSVGVWRAVSAPTGLDVLLCLLGAVAAFGAVYYILFGKR